MSKFTVGDRIVAYYNETPNEIKGTIISIPRETHVVYISDDGKEFGAHIKQIRRLVKKKREKLGRELWLMKTKLSLNYWLAAEKPNQTDGWHEVIQVREILDE